MATVTISPSSKVDVHLNGAIEKKNGTTLFLVHSFFSDLDIMFLSLN